MLTGGPKGNTVKEVSPTRKQDATGNGIDVFKIKLAFTITIEVVGHTFWMLHPLLFFCNPSQIISREMFLFVWTLNFFC